MSDDIVERLRSVLHNDRSVELMNREAANEIQRLRNDLDGSQLAYRGASYDRDRMRAERERLRKERDEARQLYCERMSEISRQQDCTAQWFAEEMEWDCFKEKP